MSRRQLAAWLVHLYTASGGVIGLFALFEAGRGNIAESFLLIILTRLIDATDGLFARAVKVWEVLPNFDGVMLDNVIDIFTYLWLPLFILWQIDLPTNEVWLIAPLLAGLYAYGQTNMKTSEGFFLGFPTLWGEVAIYIYLLRPSDMIAVLMLLIPAILSFVPLRYLYASKNRFLSVPTWILGILWTLILVYVLAFDRENQTLVWLSAVYPAYYFGASFYASYLFSRKATP